MGSRKRKPLIRNLINILLITIILSVGYICFTIVYDLRIRFINRSELKDIAGVNEDYGTRFTHFVDAIEKETDWKVEIISGLRTKEEQIQLKRDNPRNASVKKSRHVLGRAVDLNLYKRNGFRFIRLKKVIRRVHGSPRESPKLPNVTDSYGEAPTGTTTIRSTLRSTEGVYRLFGN